MQMQQSEVQQEAGEFHERDGWYFRRMQDGSVRIRKDLTSHIIDADAWASIVAHCSASGENSGSFHLAEKMHAGLL
jgi:hypothetical protein